MQSGAAVLRLLPLRAKCQQLGLPAGYYERYQLLLSRAFAADAQGDIPPNILPGSPAPGILPPNYYRPSPRRAFIANTLRILMPIAGFGCLAYAFTHPDDDPLVPARYPPDLQYLAAQQTTNTESIVNWSGTHEATPKRYFQPETEAEVEGLLRAAAGMRQRLRPVGSGLSPNGLGLSGEGMMSMALMDKVVSVDADKKQVTVQAGARVQQVVEALAAHGLSLQNYASIREQQIGGFTQVSAHGTGARVPPVDEQVVAMRLATPGGGVISLSSKQEPELFNMAKVGLGALGAVTQVTLQCVPRQQHIERTRVVSLAELKRHHVKWLKENRHMRYMWIPYSDEIFVVTVNPASSTAELEQARKEAAAPPHTLAEATEPLRQLYLQRTGEPPESVPPGQLSATELRDRLLALAPLDKAWVAKVNVAEAQYWRLAPAVRVGWSDELLGFDCGGQQWVMETCFPVGRIGDLKEGQVTPDITYMVELMKDISKAGVAAPCPIEQRWTSGSSAPLSPAHGPSDQVFSWVGIIMYLPSSDPAVRKDITDAFHKYSRTVEDKFMSRYNAVWHWAKLEPQQDEQRPDARRLARVRERLVSRFGQATLQRFAQYRAALDPTGVLGNEWLDAILPQTTPPGAVKSETQ